MLDFLIYRQNLHKQMVASFKSLAPEAARRASPNEIRRLVSELSRGNVLVITGAGLSTESGLCELDELSIIAGANFSPFLPYNFYRCVSTFLCITTEGRNVGILVLYYQ